MVNKIDDIEFWKERIDDAKKNNKIYYSVFLANETIWKKLNDDHRKILEKEIKKGDRVLDAGCGYGRNSEMIKSKKYIGVDFSPDFIELAKELYPDREFLVADIKDLPFEDKEFDVSICVSVKGMIIGNLGNKEWDKMQKELKRVSNRLLILEYGSGDSLSKYTSDKYEIL